MKRDKAKERVAIAKDALAWLEAGALEASHYYVEPEFTSFARDEQKRQLRDIVLGTCQVCALGAMFLAKAVRYDNVVVPDIFDSILVYSKLAEHFDRQQLELIELTYEHQYHMNAYGRAAGFAETFPDGEPRLRAILENIIANHGTFIP